MLCLKLESQCEGSVSLCLKISEIINLRHQDLTIDTYNTTMLNAREDLLKMNVNPGNFIANFISVIYHIGLLNFAFKLIILSVSSEQTKL